MAAKLDLMCIFLILVTSLGLVSGLVRSEQQYVEITNEGILLEKGSLEHNDIDAIGQEQQRQKSIQLSDMFKQMANSSDLPVSKELWQTFQTCGQCENFKRLGEAHDGGYLTCTDGIENGKVLAAYSMGVEHHDKWSEDVVSWLSVPVNQFDCTVDGSTCKACNFFKKCIVGADPAGAHLPPGHQNEGCTLAQALAKTSQANAPDRSLLMKMDIEGSEWPIFASGKPEALTKFSQVIVEFHGLQKVDQHPVYLQAMKHILVAGFKVVHLHGNNYGPMFHQDAVQVPEVAEVTFVHADARPDGCAPDQLYEKLDAPNNPSSPELPLARLR